MYIGTPGAAYLSLITDKTITAIERLIPAEGPVTVEIDWPQDVKYAQWWVREAGQPARQHPIFACYCDEKRDMIVVCVDGRFDSEVKNE
jgi:hypothetical protein